MVENLQPNTDYYFKIEAINLFGKAFAEVAFHGKSIEFQCKINMLIF
jgi:hypothetical protein